MSGRVDWLTSKRVVSSVGNYGEPVGTDALVCPPKHSQEKPPQAHQKEGM